MGRNLGIDGASGSSIFGKVSAEEVQVAALLSRSSTVSDRSAVASAAFLRSALNGFGILIARTREELRML